MLGHAFASLLVALPAAPQEPSPPSEPLALVATIALPGVEGRIDHLAVDLERRRLFVAALGNDSVEVLDLAAGRSIESLSGPEEPQGILWLADSDRLIVASGGGGTCEVYDGESLERIASVPVGADADNLRYDERRARVYVGCEGALGILDAKTWKALDPIPLEAHAESFQLDASGDRAFVNLPGARAVAVVDLERRAVVATWKVEEAAANYPMVLVPGATVAEEGRCLLGCRSPSKLVVRSQPDGAPVATLELSGDADDLFYDRERRRVYAACGEGFVDVFDREPAGLRRSARVATAPGARTCLFVPELDRLFVAVPHRGEQRAEIRVLAVRD